MQTSRPPHRGEIWLVQLPGQPEDWKDRPCVILSVNTRNRHPNVNDYIVVPTSSVIRSGPCNVLLKRGMGGLNADSEAKCDQITTIHESFLIRGPFSKSIPTEKLKEIFIKVALSIGFQISPSNLN